MEGSRREPVLPGARLARVPAGKHPFAVSFGIAAAATVGGSILLVLLGPDSAADDAGYVTGRLAFPLAVAALVAALVARRSTSVWPWWRYALVVIPVGLIVFLFAAVGRVAGGS